MTDTHYQDILEKLVGFDTTSCYSNLNLIEYVESFLSEYGVKFVRIPDEDESKASLYATIGPKEKPGIGLSAHTDVVPVDGQIWDTDPYKLTFDNGRYFGRGTCDMKGFLACVLASVPYFLKCDLHTPIHLLFSYDEETGCTGVRPMIERFGHDLVRPKAVIVGEPSNMGVVEAHKGSFAYVTEVHGLEAHSSAVDIGVNAVLYASLLIAEIKKISDIVKTETNERFSPAYTSIHVGMIEGGVVLNIIPKICKFVWEIRSLPGLDVTHIEKQVHDAAQVLIQEMRQVSEDANIITKCVNDVVPFLTSQSQSGQDFLSLVMKLAKQNDTHAVSYATEAGLFEDGGCPTVICGPGSIAQAHKPNEFVEKSQLDDCMIFLRGLANYASH